MKISITKKEIYKYINGSQKTTCENPTNDRTPVTMGASRRSVWRRRTAMSQRPGTTSESSTHSSPWEGERYIVTLFPTLFRCLRIHTVISREHGHGVKVDCNMTFDHDTCQVRLVMLIGQIRHETHRVLQMLHYLIIFFKFETWTEHLSCLLSLEISNQKIIPASVDICCSHCHN